MDCTICASPSSVLFSGLTDKSCPELTFTYTLQRCKQCQLIFIAPQPSLSQLFLHYPDNFHPYLASNYGKIVSFFMQAIANQYFGYKKTTFIKKLCLYPFYFKAPWLPTYVKNGRLLDVGCGVGIHLPIFKQLGWQVEGIEPNATAVAKIREKGYTVHHGILETVDLPNNYYDAICLIHVFEHVPDLRACLHKITTILKEGGELILSVPNSKSPTFTLFKQHCALLTVPIHLFHFNKDNLSLLLQQHHFHITKICYSNFLRYFIQSFLEYLNKKRSFIARIRYFSCFVSGVLDPIFHFFKRGDFITIHARYTPPDGSLKQFREIKDS